MKKLSDTLAELGLAFSFPIEIKDADGNETYYEESNGYQYKREYGDDGNWAYFEDSDGDWTKREYDASGNVTYYENSGGYWYKREYDASGNQTYYENSCGYKKGLPRSQSCDGKVIEVDGKRYQLMEL